MSKSDDDFELEALLVEAEVKEDAMDLGLDERKPGASQVNQGRGELLEDERMSGHASSTGKKYRVKAVRGDSGVCLKYIGSGTSFCLRSDCSTDHRNTSGVGLASFVAPASGALVILKNAQVAFATPTLKLSSVEPDVVERWEAQSFSLEDWQQMFQASNQGDDFVMSFQDIKQEVKASKHSDAFRTPAKKKKVLSFEQSLAEEYATSFEYATAFETTQDRSAFKKSATSATLAESVLELDRSLSSMAKGVQRMVQESASTMQEVELTADLAYRKAAAMENLVGSSGVMDESEHAYPTVWASIATLSEDVIKARRIKAAPAPPVDLSGIRLEIKASSDALNASTAKIRGFITSFAKSILKRVSCAEGDIQRLTPQRSSFHAGVGVGDEFDSLLSDAGNHGVAGQPGNGAPKKSDDQRFLDLEDKLDRVLASNQELEVRLAQIIADSEVDAVKFAGLGLRSLEEVAAWVAVNFPKRAYGLIIDVYLLLDLISDEGPTTQKDLMTEMKRRDELDIGTEAEGQALTAFLCEVPRLFHTNGTSVSAENASFFSKVPNHRAWANGTTGLKKTIEKKLSKLKKSLREVLASELTPGTVAYVVAVEALEKTISWIGAFNTYLDTTYEHLHSEVGFTSARAWALTTQLGNRIFSDLHSVRVGTTKAMGKGPESICPAILWSVYRTHDKMAGFEDANFENHPSIASEFVKFLATNTGIEGMAVLQEEVVTLKLKVKESEKQATLSVGKADKASSVADVAKKATESLVKRVTQLENRGH
jgi:hypothetical protein